MREHIGLFRGKAAGEWLTGYLLVYGGKCQIWHDIENGKWNYAVDPDTVGECTGLTDRNGKLIFEGDIVSFTRYDALGWRRDRVGQVLHHQDTASFYVLATTGDGWGWMQIESIEVIGNIHDNPELIGGTDHG